MARRQNPHARLARPPQSPSASSTSDDESGVSKKLPPRGRRSNRLPNRPHNDTQPSRKNDSRRRSRSRPPNAHAGITRPRENPQPGIAHCYRVLKSQSEFIKSKLEQLISLIDELQPDPESMDWSISPGTVCYVPIPTAQVMQPEAAGMTKWSCSRGPLEHRVRSNSVGLALQSNLAQAVHFSANGVSTTLEEGVQQHYPTPPPTPPQGVANSRPHCSSVDSGGNYGARHAEASSTRHLSL